MERGWRGCLRAEVLAVEVDCGKRQLIRQQVRFINRVNVDDPPTFDDNRLQPGQESTPSWVNHPSVGQDKPRSRPSQPRPERELGKPENSTPHVSRRSRKHKRVVCSLSGLADYDSQARAGLGRPREGVVLGLRMGVAAVVCVDVDVVGGHRGSV